jgi:hypothetical protein
MKQKEKLAQGTTLPMPEGFPSSSGGKFITEEEELQLLGALSQGPAQGFTEAEAGEVLKWAHETRLREVILQLVLEGLIQLSFREDGQLVFTAIDPAAVLQKAEERQKGLPPAPDLES